MFSSAFFKKIIPFVLTFALGLFVASFFVSIVPGFKFRKNRCGKRYELRVLKYEKERLELENQRLQQRLRETENMFLLETSVPPPPPLAPGAVEMPADSAPAVPRMR